MKSSLFRRVAPLAFLSACALVSACSLNRPAGEELVPTRREATPRYLVTASEIQGTGLTTAFDALRRLRPELLERQANVVNADAYDGLPVLYVDGVLQGKVELLNAIPAGVVREIRYLSPVAGRHEMGAMHPGGIIAVRTRK